MDLALKYQNSANMTKIWQIFIPKHTMPPAFKKDSKGDTNLRKSVGWRTFKVLAFWSEGKWQAQFLKLVPPFEPFCYI